MKFSFNKKPDSTKIEGTLTFLMDDLEKIAIIDTLHNVEKEFVKQATQELIRLHMQEIIEQIDVKSLVNAVYINTAREIAKTVSHGG